MTHAPTAIIYAYGADGPDRGGRQQQIERCQAYAARHHLQVREVVSEPKYAGSTLSRPAFGSLFAALTTMPAPPSWLLITDITRLGRSKDLHEVGYIEYRLQHVGIHIIDVDGADGRYEAHPLLPLCVENGSPDPHPLPPIDRMDRTIRSIRLTMEQVYRREEEHHQIRFASRVQLYCHFVARGGWPAVHTVDGAEGFGYRRWQCMAPGEYGPAPDDLPAGEGILLPGPADELQCFQRLYAIISQTTFSDEPLAPQLSQQVGEDWTPARAVAVFEDTTLSRIGIPGWELLTPEQHAFALARIIHEGADTPACSRPITRAATDFAVHQHC